MGWLSMETGRRNTDTAVCHIAGVASPGRTHVLSHGEHFPVWVCFELSHGISEGTEGFSPHGQRQFICAVEPGHKTLKSSDFCSLADGSRLIKLWQADRLWS